MKSLVELSAKFLQYRLKDHGLTMSSVGNGNLEISVFRSVPVFVEVDGIQEAHGISFQCPACSELGEDHKIIRWSQNLDAPNFATPSGRWKIVGTNLNDLSMYVEEEPAHWFQPKIECKWDGKVIDGFAER